MTAPLTVSITTAPAENLKGPVTFRHPTIYDTMAMGRRVTELANLGAQPGSPRLRIDDLPFQYQESAYLMATLEHVINTAPSGFYRQDARGEPVLDLGQFDQDEVLSQESFLWVLYGAYLQWRSDFRGSRRGSPEAAAEQ